MKRSAIPWIITLLMGIYVLSLSFHTKNRIPPTPSYDFYDTTSVILSLSDTNELMDIYGTYNNILEGQRQIVEASPTENGEYRITFKVNSPRPALLYINDEVLEIFLIPDSTLWVSITQNVFSNAIDSVGFEGATANICEYYVNKSQQFGQVHIRSKRNTLDAANFAAYSQGLDSTFKREIDFLSQYHQQDSLPAWFYNFEQNEIVYHKAYLKLATAYNRQIPKEYLDNVPVYNEDAVFSYYYYLYLKAFLADQENSPNLASGNLEAHTLHYMQSADSLLDGEVHDVFLTRLIFNHLKRNRITFSASLIEQYEDNFNRRKYLRFLKAQLKERQKNA